MKPIKILRSFILHLMEAMQHCLPEEHTSSTAFGFPISICHIWVGIIFFASLWAPVLGIGLVLSLLCHVYYRYF